MKKRNIKKKNKCDCGDKEMNNCCSGGKGINKCDSGGCIYLLGFIGAVVYYISQASGFWNTALALLKALVWPVFLVYGLLKFLGT